MPSSPSDSSSTSVSKASSTGPSLAALGWSPRLEPYLGEHAGCQAARVLRHDGSAVLVGTGDEPFQVPLRPATPPLAVGDWLAIKDRVIVELLPRASLLQRRDPSSGGSQPIAANVDHVGIVCGLDRPINPGRIQRFTALAWDAGASPLIVLTKADLVESTDDIENDIRAEEPAADVIVVSAETTQGLHELLERSANRTLVLVGESGAGKSTLLNALAGTEVGVTGAVRKGDNKGRHTTTSRELFVLEGDCCLIDTPGVREVGLFLDVDTIDDGFSDIAELASECRFGDCGHQGEPGCAVAAALEDGTLSSQRVQSWVKLRREAEWLERRGDAAAENRAGRELNKMIRAAVSQKGRRQ